jgi:hypothetical protein
VDAALAARLWALITQATASHGDRLATIAVWENEEAMKKAGEEVRAHYKKIGFDMPAMLARWGARAELGNFAAPRRMQ